MKVVITIAGLEPRFGGPSRTIPAFGRALAREGAAVEIIAIREQNRSEIAEFDEGVKLTTIATSNSRYHPFSWRNSFEAELKNSISTTGSTVIYDVGLWLPSNHFAAIIARKQRIPFIISPRGMLSKQAMSISLFKKRIAWATYQKRDAKSARAFHATSEAEVNDVRARGLTQPIALVANGVDLPPQALTIEKLSAQRTVLFLSRLHPIKGLKDLIIAWSRLRPTGWRVRVVGHNENNYQSELEALSRSLGIREQFEFLDAVDDNEKWKVYGAADLFVLPSYSESFGQVIAEALASGLPVITTNATPWRDIEAVKAGWWIDTGVDSLYAALGEALTCHADILRGMGERGRDLIRRKYSWPTIAQEMLRVFRWLRGLGAQRPESVREG
jgi:glycosyltransferase involved in cell wall biosynthesis